MTNAVSQSQDVTLDVPWTFESALKDATVEESVNLHLHRRLAFAIVRQMQGRFESVSPNHLTLISGALGIACGVCGHHSVEAGPQWLALSALLLMASAVFDCADGMLARLRGQSSMFGQLLDGFTDYVAGVSAWYGICYAICAGIDLPGKWLWCTFALFSVSVHVAIYDQLKVSFVAQTAAPRAAAPANAPPGRFERWAGPVYRNVYSAIMRAFGGTDTPRTSTDPAAARRHLSPAMRKATYLGLGTQLFVLYTAAFVGAFTHVWATFVICQLLLSMLCNAWVVVTLVSWKRATARLRAESEPA
jgi:phosphatidylglycerophosphate synthase